VVVRDGYRTVFNWAPLIRLAENGLPELRAVPTATLHARRVVTREELDRDAEHLRE
jgi:hypothetical protein